MTEPQKRQRCAQILHNNSQCKALAEIGDDYCMKHDATSRRQIAELSAAHVAKHLASEDQHVKDMFERIAKRTEEAQAALASHQAAAEHARREITALQTKVNPLRAQVSQLHEEADKMRANAQALPPLPAHWEKSPLLWAHWLLVHEPTPEKTARAEALIKLATELRLGKWEDKLSDDGTPSSVNGKRRRRFESALDDAWDRA